MIAATIIGNVGREPERSEDGKRTRVTVASSSGWGDNKVTTWVSCTLWGKTAEWAAANLHKGDTVAVRGTLDVKAVGDKQYVNCAADGLDRLKSVHDSPPKPAQPPASGGGSARDDIPFAKEPSIP